MVELRTRKTEIRGDGTNHHEKLGLKRTSCTSQLTIPVIVGTSLNPVCNFTDTRSSQPNKASRTPDFSYPLVSSTSFSSTSPALSFLFITLPSSQNTKLSHPSLSLHAMIMSLHRVQHTPSNAYTGYSIHRVQHTPGTASTQDCLSYLHSHDYELTPECSFSFRCASLHNPLPSASFPWDLKGKVT